MQTVEGVNYETSHYVRSDQRYITFCFQRSDRRRPNWHKRSNSTPSVRRNGAYRAANDARTLPYGATQPELRNHPKYTGQRGVSNRFRVQSVRAGGIGLRGGTDAKLAQYRKRFTIRRRLRASIQVTSRGKGGARKSGSSPTVARQDTPRSGRKRAASDFLSKCNSLVATCSECGASGLSPLGDRAAENPRPTADRPVEDVLRVTDV
jgi:hypothetical protein